MDKLTLKDALRIQDLSYEEAVQTLFGVDIKSIPLKDLHNYVIPKKTKETQITDFVMINGTTYEVIKDLEKITYAQFVDFQQYAKKKDIAGMCSCFLIPKGKKYNDAYNVEKVKEDLLSADYYIVCDYCFFFRKLFGAFVNVFLTYSTQTLKKYKMNIKKIGSKEGEEILHCWGLLLRTCKKLSHLSTMP